VSHESGNQSVADRTTQVLLPLGGEVSRVGTNKAHHGSNDPIESGLNRRMILYDGPPNSRSYLDKTPARERPELALPSFLAASRFKMMDATLD
jgi:hypothetical protein